MQYLIRVELCKRCAYGSGTMWQIPHSSNYKECVYEGCNSWATTKPSTGCPNINVAYARLSLIDVNGCCKKMLEEV